MFEANAIDREYASSLDDDERLVQAAQENPADFKPIYQKWLKPVYRYFYFRVGNERDAEDLTSQVFLKVYEDLPRYRHRGCFSAWLFSIARARAVDFYRKSHRQVLLSEAGPLPNEASIMDQTIHNDDLHQVLDLIHRLPPDQQELIRLRFVAELGYREIGSLLHRKEDAVRKAISRILDRIQTEIDHD
jgi:RNA polymerase sigma-70 factor (ECF subfamily)